MIFDLSLMQKYGTKKYPPKTLDQSTSNMTSEESRDAAFALNPVEETRSSSIPLPSSHVTRTQSEVQLSLDQAAAEERDIHMFYRLVNGIRERQSTLRSPEEHHAHSDRSIARIFQTRRAQIRSTDNILLEDDESDQDHEAPPLPPPQWQPLGSVRGRTSEISSGTDSWSITGFDGPEPATDSGTTEPATDSGTTEPEDFEEEEGIFSLDL